MANLRQIKTQIKAVKNLKKITRALEIVSTVKLQKIKKKTETLRNFMVDYLRILKALSSKVDIFETWNIRQDWKRLLIVITSERWLCGSINSKLLKHIHTKYYNIRDNVEVFCIWKKWFEFFARSWFNIVWSVNLKENFTESELNIVYAYIKESISKLKYAKIKVYFNYFENSITQIPLRFKLFPLDKDSFDSFVQDIWIDLQDHISESIKSKDILLEPTPEELKRELINQLAEHVVYWAVLQNKAWEHSSRMIAMKNATDNSKTMIDSLTLTYNKVRQWAITQEISEIVSAKIAIGW